MSRILDPLECDCDCHTNAHIMHVMACCDGQCPECQLQIKRGMMETHRTNEHNVVNINIASDWFEHMEAVHPRIKTLDRRNAESIARAHSIVVTNATK